MAPLYLEHFHISAHYGIRTERHKLIYYDGEALGSAGAVDGPTPPKWALFDLRADPQERGNVYQDP